MQTVFFDEMYDTNGECRSHYQEFALWLAETPKAVIAERRKQADILFHKAGITFTLYGDEQGTERLIPFDTIPRSIPYREWQILEAGCIQRVEALNAFLHDIYHDQRIMKEGIIPAEQILQHDQYQSMMCGLTLPNNVYAHISGVDIIRHSDGLYYVLEDNLRTPSGVSYMLEDRKMMMHLFPELFAKQRIAPVDHYPSLLLSTLKASTTVENPQVVILTPGRYNSAYFEHAFLAREMGVELVEGADLIVKNRKVYMRTTMGLQAVDVIYRRLDDAYLDPSAFNTNSMLGVSGLVDSYKAGNVILANAIGTGVADDKSIYPFVTEMIRFYLSDEPILFNVETWQCRNPNELSHVLANLEHLVVKETQGSGGYGMLIGPAASKKDIADFKDRLKANPQAYIAQPTLALSTCPTFVDNGIAPRHLDLRPFVLSSQETQVVPGGLTRVALKEGSLVVNSSQGGGTKDTWIIED